MVAYWRLDRLRRRVARRPWRAGFQFIVVALATALALAVAGDTFVCPRSEFARNADWWTCKGAWAPYEFGADALFLLVGLLMVSLILARPRTDLFTAATPPGSRPSPDSMLANANALRWFASGLQALAAVVAVGGAVVSVFAAGGRHGLAIFLVWAIVAAGHLALALGVWWGRRRILRAAHDLV